MKKIILSVLLCNLAHAGVWVGKDYLPTKELKKVCELMGFEYKHDLHAMKEKFDKYNIKNWKFLAEQPLNDFNGKQIPTNIVKEFLVLYDSIVKPTEVNKKKITSSTVAILTSGERDQKTNEILAKLLAKYKDCMERLARIFVFLKYNDSEEIMRDVLDKEFSGYKDKFRYIVASDTANVAESCAQDLNDAWYKVKGMNFFTIAQKPNFNDSVKNYLRVARCIGAEMQPTLWEEGIKTYYTYDKENNREYPYPFEAWAKGNLHMIAGELFNALAKLEKIKAKQIKNSLYVSYLDNTLLEVKSQKSIEGEEQTSSSEQTGDSGDSVSSQEE